MTGNQSGAAQSTTATSILKSVQDSILRLGIQSLDSKLKSYKGSLPYMTFGFGENSHKAIIALGKLFS